MLAFLAKQSKPASLIQVIHFVQNTSQSQELSAIITSEDDGSIDRASQMTVPTQISITVIS